MSAAGMPLPPVAPLSFRDTHRLVAAVHPSTGILDLLSEPGDLGPLLELEAWTDDRVTQELGILLRLPRREWVVGTPYSQVVMSAYCHPSPSGGRFNDALRGCWYAAGDLATAHAESIHRRVQALAEIGAFETAIHVRLWLADASGLLHDLREPRAEFEPYYHPDDYGASQQLARELLRLGSDGIVYRSVRHPQGLCVACLQPRTVTNVRPGGVYEYAWTGRREPQIRMLAEA